jgi:hypothetical protein
VLVEPESLPFNMADLVEQSLAEWYGTQPPATPTPEVESVGDFIVAEFNRQKLRYYDGWVVRFEAEAEPDVYRTRIFAALDLWLAWLKEDRTPGARDAYADAVNQSPRRRAPRNKF